MAAIVGRKSAAELMVKPSCRMSMMSRIFQAINMASTPAPSDAIVPIFSIAPCAMSGLK